LELLASDSEYMASSGVLVHVVARVANQAPTVTISGPSAVSLPPGNATLTGSVRDDGLPVTGSLQMAWTKVMRLGDFMAEGGGWKGESAEEILRILREGRAAGTSGEPPKP
jgi:hypothetical protein